MSSYCSQSLHSYYNKHTMNRQHRSGQPGWAAEPSSQQAPSCHGCWTMLEPSLGRGRAGGRETEKLQSVLLLISDLHKVETFHGPPQITIASGALEEFKKRKFGFGCNG